MNFSREVTASDAYEITSAMIQAKTGRKPNALCAWINAGLIPRGKRRRGVRGVFWTAAQANKLLSRIGSTAERFEE